MTPNAAAVVRRSLAGSGIELVASCPVADYDAAAPEPFRSPVWLTGARGLVVAASAGPSLWRGFRSRDETRTEPSKRDDPHPFDAFVGELLARADRGLASEGVAFRRFDAAFDAVPRVNFLALGRLVGLGSPSPFGMLIHPRHGPWWALRGAWLVDADVEPPVPFRAPCEGCPAPCVGGWRNGGGIDKATWDARRRCVVGQASRYDDDQIAYHADRVGTASPALRG